MRQTLDYRKKLNILYFFLQLLFWGAAVVHYAYMTQILEAKGYAETEIGLLNGAKLLTGIICQLLLGTVCDRLRYRFPLKYVIAILAAGTVFLTGALYVTDHNFVRMLLISMGFGALFTTLQPMIDSLSILYAEHGIDVNYAKGRMGGSLSWAVLCVLVGQYCDLKGMHTVPLLAVLPLLVLMLLAAWLPWEQICPDCCRKGPGVSEKSEKKNSVWELLRNYPQFVLFLAGSAIMYMGYNFGSTFLIDFICTCGGNNTHYGLAQFVLAISEVPSAFIMIRLRKRVPNTLIMVCCAVFMTLKNLIPAYTDSVAVIIMAQGSEMLGFGLFYSGSMYFIEDCLPAEDIVKATALVSVATVGIGEGIGALCCGFIRKQIGVCGLMRLGALVNALAVPVFLSIYVIYEKKGKKSLKEY